MTENCLVKVQMRQLWRVLLALIISVLNACANKPIERVAAAVVLGESITPAVDLHSVTSFDVFQDQGQLHILVAGSTDTDPKRMVLRYLHSADGGATWSKPQLLNDLLPPAMATRGNDVQLAVSGQHLLALWQTPGELPGMGPLIGAYSTDGGKIWTAAANPAVNMAGDQSHLDLSVDTEGRFHGVWLEDPEENGYQSLRYASSQDDGKSWTAAQTLDHSTCSCCWNTLLVNSGGDLNILYRDMEPRDMALMQSTDHGQHWQQLSKVGDFNWVFNGCPHIGGALSIDEAQVMHSLVWTGLEAKQGLYYLNSSAGGKQWTAPLRMGNKALHGDLAVSPNNLFAVWDELGPEGSAIQAAQSLDQGKTWQASLTLSAKSGQATHPRVLATSKGYTVFWTEKVSKQISRLRLAMFKIQP